MASSPLIRQIRRVLVARPAATPGDIRNMVPEARDQSDDQLRKLLDHIRASPGPKTNWRVK